MVTFGTLEKMAVSFPSVTVEPHFEKLAFKVKKKLFATYDENNNKVTVKLSEADQDAFSSLSSNVYQVDNTWGKQGWTVVELNGVNQDVLFHILTTAYCEVAPKTLVQLVKRNDK